MGENVSGAEPLFQADATIRIAVTPQAAVSDLARSGAWSPECQGGTWSRGEPGAVGSVFEGRNLRSPEVVAWAPVVRGAWTTHSEVVTAEPGRAFFWAMHNSAGEKQDSVWGFEIEAADEGTVLTHRFRMGTPTEGILGITAEMDQEQKQQFFKEWGEKISGDLAATLRRIKAVLENG
jgi:hypothetical protein